MWIRAQFLTVVALGLCRCAGPATDTERGLASPVQIEEPAPPQTRGVAAEPIPPPRSVTIAASGDLIVNHRVRKAWTAMGTAGQNRSLEAFKSAHRATDVVFLNLETPLVDDEVALRTGWPPVLGSPPGVAEALAAAGVDVVSLANNHAYDQGFRGLQRSRGLLDDAGIVHLGTGPTKAEAFRPRVVERDGVKIAFLAFAGHTNADAQGGKNTPLVRVARLWTEDYLWPSLAAARKAADVVVVSVHWSSDFVAEPTDAQRKLARRFVDAGADVVLGTGPHILHPVERLHSERGDALVAYSLGNLVSGMAFRYRPGLPPPVGHLHPSNVVPEARDAVILRVTVDVPEPAKSGRLRISALEAVPLWTRNSELEHHEKGVPLEIRLVPLDREESLGRERVPRIEAALGAAVEVVQ